MKKLLIKLLLFLIRDHELMSTFKKDLAKLANGKYYALSVEIVTHSGGHTYTEYCAYIDGYHHNKGSTMKDALEKMRLEVEGPEKSKKKQIVVC